jgi:hypothetical protein
MPLIASAVNAAASEQRQTKCTLRVEEMAHVHSPGTAAGTLLTLQWPSAGTLP